MTPSNSRSPITNFLSNKMAKKRQSLATCHRISNGVEVEPTNKQGQHLGPWIKEGSFSVIMILLFTCPPRHHPLFFGVCRPLDTTSCCCCCCCLLLLAAAAAAAAATAAAAAAAAAAAVVVVVAAAAAAAAAAACCCYYCCCCCLLLLLLLQGAWALDSMFGVAAEKLAETMQCKSNAFPPQIRHQLPCLL